MFSSYYMTNTLHSFSLILKTILSETTKKKWRVCGHKLFETAPVKNFSASFLLSPITYFSPWDFSNPDGSRLLRSACTLRLTHFCFWELFIICVTICNSGNHKLTPWVADHGNKEFSFPRHPSWGQRYMTENILSHPSPN